jgi:hypothetical protein
MASKGCTDIIILRDSNDTAHMTWQARAHAPSLLERLWPDQLRDVDREKLSHLNVDMFGLFVAGQSEWEECTEYKYIERSSVCMNRVIRVIRLKRMKRERRVKRGKYMVRVIRVKRVRMRRRE